MEMSRQKMKMAPVDFVNVDCKGYLVKLDGVSKTWKKRFCVLSDAFLYLYTDQETEYALGTCALKKAYKIVNTRQQDVIKNIFTAFSCHLSAWIPSSIHWKSRWKQKAHF